MLSSAQALTHSTQLCHRLHKHSSACHVNGCSSLHSAVPQAAQAQLSLSRQWVQFTALSCATGCTSAAQLVTSMGAVHCTQLCHRLHKRSSACHVNGCSSLHSAVPQAAQTQFSSSRQWVQFTAFSCATGCTNAIQLVTSMGAVHCIQLCHRLHKRNSARHVNGCSSLHSAVPQAVQTQHSARHVNGCSSLHSAVPQAAQTQFSSSRQWVQFTAFSCATGCTNAIQLVTSMGAVHCTQLCHRLYKPSSARHVNGCSSLHSAVPQAVQAQLSSSRQWVQFTAFSCPQAVQAQLSSSRQWVQFTALSCATGCTSPAQLVTSMGAVHCTQLCHRLYKPSSARHVNGCSSLHSAVPQAVQAQLSSSRQWVQFTALSCATGCTSPAQLVTSMGAVHCTQLCHRLYKPSSARHVNGCSSLHSAVPQAVQAQLSSSRQWVQFTALSCATGCTSPAQLVTSMGAVHCTQLCHRLYKPSSARHVNGCSSLHSAVPQAVQAQLSSSRQWVQFTALSCATGCTSPAQLVTSMGAVHCTQLCHRLHKRNSARHVNGCSSLHSAVPQAAQTQFSSSRQWVQFTALSCATGCTSPAQLVTSMGAVHCTQLCHRLYKPSSARHVNALPQAVQFTALSCATGCTSPAQLVTSMGAVHCTQLCHRLYKPSSARHVNGCSSLHSAVPQAVQAQLSSSRQWVQFTALSCATGCTSPAQLVTSMGAVHCTQLCHRLYKPSSARHVNGCSSLHSAVPQAAQMQFSSSRQWVQFTAFSCATGCTNVIQLVTSMGAVHCIQLCHRLHKRNSARHVNGCSSLHSAVPQAAQTQFSSSRQWVQFTAFSCATGCTNAIQLVTSMGAVHCIQLCHRLHKRNSARHVNGCSSLFLFLFCCCCC